VLSSYRVHITAASRRTAYNTACAFGTACHKQALATRSALPPPATRSRRCHIINTREHVSGGYTRSSDESIAHTCGVGVLLCAAAFLEDGAAVSAGVSVALRFLEGGGAGAGAGGGAAGAVGGAVGAGAAGAGPGAGGAALAASSSASLASSCAFFPAVSRPRFFSSALSCTTCTNNREYWGKSEVVWYMAYGFLRLAVFHGARILAQQR
jgi:hypothetical protein